MYNSIAGGSVYNKYKNGLAYRYCLLFFPCCFAKHFSWRVAIIINFTVYGSLLKC